MSVILRKAKELIASVILIGATTVYSMLGSPSVPAKYQKIDFPNSNLTAHIHTPLFSAGTAIVCQPMGISSAQITWAQNLLRNMGYTTIFFDDENIAEGIPLSRDIMELRDAIEYLSKDYDLENLTAFGPSYGGSLLLSSFVGLNHSIDTLYLWAPAVDFFDEIKYAVEMKQQGNTILINQLRDMVNKLVIAGQIRNDDMHLVDQLLEMNEPSKLNKLISQIPRYFNDYLTSISTIYWLETPEMLNIRKVVMLYGNNDPYIPEYSIDRLTDSLKNRGIEVAIIRLRMDHGPTVPSLSQLAQRFKK